MKLLPLFLGIGFLTVLAPYTASAQSVGIGTNSPNKHAVLDLVVPTPTTLPQGLLLPRLTTSQKNSMSISNTEKGMMVYDTDLNMANTWNGTAWSTTTNDGDWDITTSAGDATTNLNVGIGITNPSQKLEVGGDVIIGGGSTLSDGTSEFIQFQAESASWYMGAYNNSSASLSDFYISPVNGGDGTFHIEMATGEVGIGTTTPGYDLDVQGTTYSSSMITKSFQFLDSPSQDHVLKSDATGKARWEKSLAPIILLTIDFSANTLLNSSEPVTNVSFGYSGNENVIKISGYTFDPTKHSVIVTPIDASAMLTVVDYNSGNIHIKAYDNTFTLSSATLQIAIFEY